MKPTTIYTGIKELLTFSGVVAKSGRKPTEADLSAITNGALIVTDGQIAWSGPKTKLKSALKNLSIKKAREIDLKAETVMPAFVDCHTHLVFAGDREHEFEMRNQGATYQDIAARGGGIKYTVKQTRAAKPAELLELAEARLDRLIDQGVASVEIKSGYGLSEPDELKILNVIKKLKSRTSARLIATYLGPHAVPPDRNKSEYLNEVIEKTLPKIKDLADRVDIFIEDQYYTLPEARRYFERARELGLAITAHADQLTRTGASLLLNELGAQSIDHCVQVSENDVRALARGETTCVLLPTSDFYLKMKYPPARALIDAGTRVALATDYNPGTSPSLDLSLVGVLARLEMRMSLPEVLAALTTNAAVALGLGTTTGVLIDGYSADFVVLNENWRRLFYEVGFHPVRATYCRGIHLKTEKS